MGSAHPRIAVDLQGRLLEQLARRIVGNCYKVDHRVHAVEVFPYELAAIFDDDLEPLVLRQELATEKETIDRPHRISLVEQRGYKVVPI